MVLIPLCVMMWALSLSGRLNSFSQPETHGLFEFYLALKSTTYGHCHMVLIPLCVMMWALSLSGRLNSFSQPETHVLFEFYLAS